MDRSIPTRIEWALDLLSGKRPELLLEIGSGPGLACRRFLRQHGRANYIGLDRSAVSRDKFRNLNADMIEAGRASFVHDDFLDQTKSSGADVGLAINVNAFWTNPVKSFAAAKRLLMQPAFLLLIYEAPGPEKAKEICRLVDEFGRADFKPGPAIQNLDARTLARWFRLVA